VQNRENIFLFSPVKATYNKLCTAHRIYNKHILDSVVTNVITCEQHMLIIAFLLVLEGIIPYITFVKMSNMPFRSIRIF